AAKLGWPTPTQTGQAPDLLLYAADDYEFTEKNLSQYVTPTVEIGAHGYPNTNPLMQAIFIAAGAGIRHAGEIPAFPDVDVAPTIAHLLRVRLEGEVQGKTLTKILATGE
ncbi:MAG TPA: hypothetical protein VJR95_10930, partial [Rhodanobacter sp.]|nr:hypothetical protein [Rhodanobacter sp.]